MSGLTGEINWADLVDDEGVDGAPGGRHRLSSVGTDSSHQSHGETSTGDKGVPTDATGLDIATSLPHGPPYRMFVGQVPFEAEATHVARFFESKGCKVSQESCAMNKHQDGSRKCSAFIDILDEESVMRALSLTDTRMMDPANRDKYRKVRIEVARKPKPSGDRDGHNRERRNNANKGHQQNGGRGGGIMFQNKDQQNQRGGGRGGGTGGRNQRGGIFGKGKNAPAVSDDDFMDFRTRGTASSQPKSGTDHENSSKAEQQKQHQHGDPTESGEPKTRTSLKLKPRQKKEGQEDSDPARSGRDETLFGGARPNNVNYLDKPETATRAPPTSEKHKGEQLSSNREKQEGTGAGRGKGRGGNRRGGRGGGGKPSGNKAKESRGDSGDKPGKTKQSKRTIPMAQAKVPSEEERLAKQQEEMHKAAGNNNFAALGMMDSDEESGSDAE